MTIYTSDKVQSATLEEFISKTCSTEDTLKLNRTKDFTTITNRAGCRFIIPAEFEIKPRIKKQKPLGDANPFSKENIKKAMNEGE